MTAVKSNIEIIKQTKMTILSTIKYEGDLRTTNTHLRSGVHINTDAPIDNNGKGACFSPTDLVATGLGSCMITLMGIAANKNDFLLGEVGATIVKEMASNPRRISRIQVELTFNSADYTSKQRKIMETAALNCPVAKSIHPDIEQDVSFTYNA